MIDEFVRILFQTVIFKKQKYRQIQHEKQHNFEIDTSLPSQKIVAFINLLIILTLWHYLLVHIKLICVFAILIHSWLNVSELQTFTIISHYLFSFPQMHIMP